MTIYDFLELCIEPNLLHVQIYDFSSQKVVFDGNGDEIPEELTEAEISSFDVPDLYGRICLNVELAQDDPRINF